VKVAIGKDTNSEVFDFKSFSDFIIPSSQDPSCLTPSNDPIAVPNSNAFLDLNGDCMADIFI
jgi:hypothetical protein